MPEVNEKYNNIVGNVYQILKEVNDICKNIVGNVEKIFEKVECAIHYLWMRLVA